MFKLSVVYDETIVRVAQQVGHDYRVGSARLAAGVVGDGVILRPSAFGDALRAAIASANVSPDALQSVVVAVPERRVFTKLVTLPKIPTHELAGAITWQAHTALPSDPSVLAIAHQVLSTTSSQHTTVLVVAAPREVVESIWQACQAAHFLPVAIVPQSLGLAQFVYQQTSTPQLLVSGDADNSVSLIVTKNRTARFSTSIAQSTSVAKLRANVAHVLEFYEGKDGRQRRIKEILVLPGPGAVHLYRALTSAPALRPVQLVHAKGAIHADRAYLDDYLANFGLLQVTQSLNLLLPEQRAVLDAHTQEGWLRIGWHVQVALATVLVAGAAGLVSWRFASNQTLPPPAPLTVSQEAQRTQHRLFAQALARTASLDGKRSSLAQRYAAITSAMNPDIQLVSVSFESQAKVFVITGQRASRESLRQFLHALAPHFPALYVPASNWADVEGGVFRVEAS